MQYIKMTYIDSQTKKPVTESPAKNGMVHPLDAQVDYINKRSNPPHIYGKVDDDVDTNVAGVLELLSEDEYNSQMNTFLQVEKKHKSGVIELYRARLTQYMPYTTPDGAEVQVKIAEEPPNKPRQTWLAGASAKALAAKVKGESFANDLIAADDTRHSMSEDDWITLGEMLHQWIKDHIDVAREHIANVKALDTVDDVIAYDITTNPEWPS